MVRDKVGTPPGEFGVSKSMECDIFPFSALTLLVLGYGKGIRAVKNWVLICWWWWFDWSFARLISPVVTSTSIILCFNKHRLTQVHLENGRWNGERERERPKEQSCGHLQFFFYPNMVLHRAVTFSMMKISKLNEGQFLKSLPCPLF